MNVYLFRKYWGKHKGRLFSLILSIIIFVGTFVFSALNERSELRRQLHKSFDIYGHYAAVAHNVTEEQGEKIKALPYKDMLGIVSASGKIHINGKSYTVGCFENDEAENTCHLPLIEGQMPTRSGQIAIPRFILNLLSPNAQIGDKITLEFEDFENNISSRTYELSGIIGNYTVRTDMEYMGNRDEITVTAFETEHPTPSVYVHRDDTAGMKKYYNYFISASDESYFSEEGIKRLDETLEKFWNISNEQSNGMYTFIMLGMSGKQGNQTVIQTEASDTIKVIRIISIFMIIVSAISMFSGVVSIMPQRVGSLKLLRLIGMSKRKLLQIFITEFFIFWFIGNILGIALGCGVHELITALQKLQGIAVYRGYTAEYIIEQRTSSPFILPVSASLMIAAVSLIVPIRSIFSKKSKSNKRCTKAVNLRKAFSKITGVKKWAALPCISMAIVIISTVFGYCYYTETDKGSSFFSFGKETVSEAYYKVNGIDLKENGIDCSVTASIPSALGLSVYDNEYGITESELASLGKSANCLAWGRYPTDTVIYGKDEKVPPLLNDSLVPLNENGEYYNEFKDNKIYNLPLIFINENMMDMLCESEPDDVILLSSSYNFAYEVGDAVPMFTCLCNDTGHLRLDTMKHINTVITKQLNISEIGIEENDILNNCGSLHFSGNAVAMTVGTAEKLGFYHPGYSSVMMKFKTVINEKGIKNYISDSVKKPVGTVTIYELERNAKMRRLSSNANSTVLFLLLFILNIIAIYNILNMNVKNNVDKFYIMHSLGMSYKKIKKIFVGNVMIITAAALIIGIALSAAGKYLLSEKYNEYYSLLAEVNEMYGNTDFPDAPVYFISSELETSDPMYEITVKMESLKETFFLDKEMWLPDLFTPLCIICAIIFLNALICSLSAAKNIRSERSRSND